MKPTHVLSLVLVAAAAAGCRSHAKAVAPQVAPAQATVTRRAPEATHVEATNKDFVPATQQKDDVSSDPLAATAMAEQKGLLRDAFFAFDSAAMTPDSEMNLQTSAKFVEGHPKFHVLVEGHCDERGTEKYNLALGDKRAYEAKEYLQTLGVDANEIATISYGKEKPFDPGHDEDAWAKNRRAHLVLTAPK